MAVISLVLYGLLAISSGQRVCDSDNSLYKIPGDAIITGFFAAHEGENCTRLHHKNIQVIRGLIASVSALSNFIPGIRIGLSVYDTCASQEVARKSVVSALVEAECSDSFVIGGVVESPTGAYVKNLSQSLNFPLIELPDFNFNKIDSSVAAKVLRILGWSPIHYFVTQDDSMDHFIESATINGMCIYHKLKLNEMDSITPGGTVVIMADFAALKAFVKPLPDSTILVVPSDGYFEPLEEFRSSTTIVLARTVLGEPALINPVNGVTEDNQSQFPRATVNWSLEQLQFGDATMKLALWLKEHVKLHCLQMPPRGLCPELPKMGSEYKLAYFRTLNNVEDVQRGMKIFSSIKGADFNVFEIYGRSNEGMMKLGDVKIGEKDWVINILWNETTDDPTLCRNKPVNDSTGFDCTECLNYDLLYKDYIQDEIARSALPNIELKPDAWVATILTMSVVGSACCVAIFVFIVVRMCKKDLLEGNPGCSFVMLVSLILAYASVLPFTVNVTAGDDKQFYAGVLCGLKLFGTSLSYSFIYSVMLARSLMLASCDEDGGFMSHVNGYLQAILCLFIVGVQLALSVQFWAVNWVLLNEDRCEEMTRGCLFLYLLGYNMLLILIFVLCTPFIMKSKRNYQEGGYFAVASFATLGVWIAWCTGFILQPKWSDFFVCFGLVSSATVVLVIVFIPRTYLMLTGIVRDHIVSTLPTLSHASGGGPPSILDINYRSTQALYDTLNQGQTNPNYYSDAPATPSTSKMEDPYERFEANSPLNVTRF